MKNTWIYVVLIFLCFGTLKVETHKEPDKVSKAVWSDSGTSVSSDILAIEKSLELVSKEDCEVLYHLFGGLSTYSEKYDGIKSNNQALGLFALVKTRYGLKSEGLDRCNDVIESRLRNEGFETPKDFDSESRAKFVKCFKDFQEGALKAWRSKK